MKVSVAIPTWRRTAPLSRCLDALERQDRSPDQLVLVVRREDRETREMLTGRRLPFRLDLVAPPRPGLLAALNAGLDRVDGDLVAFTDDDTAPYPDWLQKIETRFEEDPNLGGLGGRDRMPAKDGVGWEEPRDVTVGRVLWFGRVVGNHNFGSGPMREVDVLKGANMAFRMSAIGDLRIDTALLGDGTQHHTEVELCLALKAAGWKIAFDPAILVDHYEEQRPGGNRLKAMSSEEQHDTIHNRAYEVLKHLPPHRRIPVFAYGVLVGSRDAPGLLLTAESLLRGAPPRTALRRLRVTIAAHRAALASRRAARQRARGSSSAR